MGVPAFYKWLVDKYPHIVDSVVEDKWLDELGNAQAVDATQPNPNGIEITECKGSCRYDSLYLDMNGIIHPCFHPEDRANPTSEAEVFRNIFEYIDRLFSIIRPRKLLYMAIDGVAPRAKMNQQRSRRFRAAQEAQERKREESSLRRQLEREGIKVPPPEDDSAKFDSNVITPGTPFMWRLSIALQYYIHLRLNHSPAWRNVEVILSDSNSPGEGEHKVMKFIRLQRGLNGYDPNMRHVVYGLDADLIMLCLATHEAHCTILREQVQPNKQDSETEEEKMQRILREAEDQRKREGKEDSEERKPPISTKPFQLLSIPKLRQYLQLDLQLHDPNVPQDDEAILDDFVFICFFVGNDFLPHSPTLEIREKAIDLLMQVYKSNLRHIGGHLCTGPDVHLDRVERFARLVAQYEEQIFVKRMRIADKQKNIRQREKQSKGGRIDHRDPGIGQYQPDANAEFCRDHQRGRCSRGTDCRFRHPGENDSKRKREDEHKQSSGRKQDERSTNSQGNKYAAAALRSKLSSSKRTQHPDDAESVTESKARRTDESLDVSKRSKQQNQAEEAADADANDKQKRSESDGELYEKNLAKSEKNQAQDEDNEQHNQQQHEAHGQQQFWALLVKKSKKNKKQQSQEQKDEKAKKDHASWDVEPAEEENVQRELNAKEFEQKLEAIMKENNEVDEDDTIRLGESGWHERYYQDKVNATPETMQSIVADMVREYVRGLCWVMRYYYEGCCSWGWYYPYHYAPFISDLVNLSDIDTSFELGEPFKPLDQLMSVLPSASAHCLPEPYAELMRSPDSPIADFYPIDFQLDMNGKRFAWQAVCLLPFIDENRLLAETKSREAQLSAEECRRNMQSLATMFVHPSHPLAGVAQDMEKRFSILSANERIKTEEPLDPEKCGFNGFMALPAGSCCPSRLESPVQGCEDIHDNHVWAFCYKDPRFRQVEPKLLPGAEPPKDENITSASIRQPKLWHEDIGKGPQQAQELSRQMQMTTNPMAFAPQQQQNMVLYHQQMMMYHAQAQAQNQPQQVPPQMQVQQQQQMAGMMPPQQLQHLQQMMQMQQTQQQIPPMGIAPPPVQPGQMTAAQYQQQQYMGHMNASAGPFMPQQGSQQGLSAQAQASPQQDQGQNTGGKFAALGQLPRRRDPRQ